MPRSFLEIPVFLGDYFIMPHPVEDGQKCSIVLAYMCRTAIIHETLMITRLTGYINGQ